MKSWINLVNLVNLINYQNWSNRSNPCSNSCFLSDGPYGLFAGQDASRGLATFSISPDSLKDEYDDLSDLPLSDINNMKEWAAQFQGELSVPWLCFVFHLYYRD